MEKRIIPIEKERIIPIEKESIAEPEKHGKPAPADPEILKKAEAMRNQMPHMRRKTDINEESGNGKKDI
jgi:hypothetical protein